MPSFTHIVECPYFDSFRASKIAGMFDIPPTLKLKKEWQVDFPIENLKDNWNVGLIVGASGSGKSILSSKIFGEKNIHKEFKWNENNSFIDDFPKELNITEIVEALSHVGFSSPPSWLLPYQKLSNGQKFRAEIARVLFEYKDLAIVDEFTSVIDRNVAKIGCAAIQKLIRKQNKKLVAVSCHYDIIEWLEPDWYYDVSSNQFFAGRLRRPSIQLEIYKCKKDCWRLFKEHHYLSSDIANGAQCFILLINNEPAAFASFIHFQHPKVINTKREHRTVVLPDYQGIGIGNILSEYVGDYCLNLGHNYISTSSHPAMIFHRMKSKKWFMYRSPALANGFNKNYKNKNQTAWNRLTASFKYLGNSNNFC
jgi:hypothetical protein